VAATATDRVQAQHAQRTRAKRATLDQLRKKGRTAKEFDAKLNGEDVSFLFKAIGSVEYDQMITAAPPTTQQKAEGASYNQDKFAPALLAKVCIEPELTVEEWTEIWTSPDWSRGEVGQLFWTCVELCNDGLSLVPTAQG
jgi:hypothetical protein